jgi:methylthioribose-1-phosphate isomerase
VSFATVRLGEKGVELLDQRLLPHEERYLVLETAEEVARAIEEMAVRGAPAIGITAAMGLAIELARAPDAKLAETLTQVGARLRATRPTAVNLSWALERMEGEL